MPTSPAALVRPLRRVPYYKRAADPRVCADSKSIFDVAPDWESYEYTPLDFKADRDFILGCWAWTNEVDGLKYADGKVFK